MIKISLEHHYCIIEPQGPLCKDDFLEIARQIDPVIERDGYLDGLIIKTRDGVYAENRQERFQYITRDGAYCIPALVHHARRLRRPGRSFGLASGIAPVDALVV